MKSDAQRFADFEEELMTGINVTPLVDVCLVLVIIFMVTTPLLSRPAFDVKLPVAATKEGEEKDKVTISLGKGDRLAIDAQEAKTLAELKAMLELKLQLTDSRIVVLRADREATHGKLTELMALAKEAGAKSISIATEQKK